MPIEYDRLMDLYLATEVSIIVTAVIIATFTFCLIVLFLLKAYYKEYAPSKSCFKAIKTIYKTTSIILISIDIDMILACILLYSWCKFKGII